MAIVLYKAISIPSYKQRSIKEVLVYNDSGIYVQYYKWIEDWSP